MPALITKDLELIRITADILSCHTGTVNRQISNNNHNAWGNDVTLWVMQPYGDHAIM